MTHVSHDASNNDAFASIPVDENTKESGWEEEEQGNVDINVDMVSLN
jgi:hypothetical protein